jgi:hypothetical protein
MITLPKSILSSLQILGVHRPTGGSGPPEGSLGERIRRILGVFEAVDARWALVGAHAIGMFTEPRATVDFDFVIEESKLRRVLKALEEELGELDTQDLGPALRLGALDVDLIRSSTHPLFQEALDRVRLMETWRVPVPEVLIVLKFLSSVSPWRGLTKKTYDIADLRALFHAVGKDQLDLDLMQQLASLVYPGAESEFEELIGRIDRGEPLTI